MIVKKRFTCLNGLVLGLALIFAVFPVFWILSTSVKPPREWVVSPPVWVTENATLDNYLSVLYPQAILQQGRTGQDTATGIQRVGESAWRSIIGSVLVSVCATALSVVVGLMAAISIARYRFGGNTTPFFILTG